MLIKLLIIVDKYSYNNYFIDSKTIYQIVAIIEKLEED